MHMINTVFQKYVLVTLVLIFMSGCSILSPKPKADYTVKAANMDFVFVKGGTYEMGSAERSDEQPVHSVSIQDLFVGMYEVTFDQFDQYCATDPLCEPPYDNKWGRGDRPVINVSWPTANAYAEWLSEQTGLTLRLPSESEWEYFARAGTTTRYWTGDSLPEGATNCRDCDNEPSKMTVPVGSFTANPWGLYDTTGNVLEWLLDDYQKNYTVAPSDGSAVSAPYTPGKSVRGGSWRDRRKDITSSSRDYYSATRANNHIGFRLVLQPSDNITALNAK